MISGVVLRAQSDGKLAALAAEGSEPAFEALVKRYRRVLICYCRRLLLSEARSEDAVQQAFLNAWAALRRGTEVRDVRAWLYRITHNEALSALRRPGYDFDELSDSIRGADATESDLDRRMLMRETLAALAALPELQREAILRTAIDGSSYEEVADALGISDGSVRGLVYRARATLRAGLAALAPGPVVLWAAGQARRTPLNERLGDAIAGGGTMGGGAAVIKGATVLASTAAVVGGTVTLPGLVAGSRPSGAISGHSPGRAGDGRPTAARHEDQSAAGTTSTSSRRLAELRSYSSPGDSASVDARLSGSQPAGSGRSTVGSSSRVGAGAGDGSSNPAHRVTQSHSPGSSSGSSWGSSPPSGPSSQGSSPSGSGSPSAGQGSSDRPSGAGGGPSTATSTGSWGAGEHQMGRQPEGSSGASSPAPNSGSSSSPPPS